MTFAFPAALFCLLGAPALLAIYWLRSRHRRQPVSSLVLWADQHKPKQGGLVVDRLQTPLLLLLELLAIALLSVAAAGPMINTEESRTPLTIVLDDSFSMNAGEGESENARSRGSRIVEDEVSRSQHSSIRFVLAGDTPQLLGEETADPEQALTLLANWKCFSASSNLQEAITLAFTLTGERGRVLVISDQPAIDLPENGRLIWRAAGAPVPNLGFVNATRTARDGQERCLLEIANLSPSSATTTLVIEAASQNGSSVWQPLRRSDLALEANGIQRVVLTLKEGAGVLRARLGPDALAIDNEVVLLPQTARPLRLNIQIANETVRGLVENAVRAIKYASVDSPDPELILTDQSNTAAASSDAWVMQFVTEGTAEAYVGPFVLDRNHPLTDGLSLDGVVWGAGKTASQAGSPVITAGNIPLLSDIVRADGRHDLRMQFSPDRSTLQDSPNWPVLIWNLIDWRASMAPGIRQSNVRLGGEAVLRVSAEITTVDIRNPDGAQHRMPVTDRSVIISTGMPGIYEVRAGSETYSLAANALRREESDLQTCSSGTWGDWNSATGSDLGRRSLTWLFLLLLVAVLAVHLFIVARKVSS